jgi:hypothetical protein
MKVAFLNRVTTTEFSEGLHVLEKPFYFLIEEEGKPIVEVTVPAGFVTDFCSVPRIPFAYLLFGNIGNRAGVAHDALYSPWNKIRVVDQKTQQFVAQDRAWADSVLGAALKECGVGWFARAMMVSAVRLAGWNFYKHTKLTVIDYIDENGEYQPK